MGAARNGAAIEAEADGSGDASVMSLAAAATRQSARLTNRTVRPHPARPHPTRITEPATEPATVAWHVAAERQRIAGALHDDVSSLLFAIATGVQRAEILHCDDVDELRRTISRVSEQVLEASDRLREVLRGCTPAEPADGVPAAAQRDLDDLAERSGIGAHLVVRGPVRGLSTHVERAGLNCLRQALFNVERHARARTVIVTLSYSAGEFVLIVQDDGRGLPTGYEPRAVPEAGHHWGFASMARQVEQGGGELELTDVEEGGTQLRVRLPV